MKGFLLFFLLQFFIPHVQSVWIKEMENPNLFEGDIILEPHEKFPNGSFNYNAQIGRRWPNPIPYEFGRDMKRQPRGMRVIREAIEQYHKYTCIRFKPRTNEKGYIRFDFAAGCASGVGYYKDKVNTINLDGPCWNHIGTVMHEMGHRLGMWHEQARPDRDKYVEILWENIAEEMKFNFKKKTWKEVDDLGTPYDLESMMHYGTAAFSLFGQRTIKVRDYSKRLLIGQRNGFSNKDVRLLNLMYNCPVFRGTVPPKVCVDTGVRNCAHYKKIGRCRDPKYEQDMYQECCKTCFGHVAGSTGESKTWPPGERRTKRPPTKPVQPTPPGHCKDKKDKKTCEYWARIGNCNSSSSVIRKFTQENCCATCKAHSHG